MFMGVCVRGLPCIYMCAFENLKYCFVIYYCGWINVSVVVTLNTSYRITGM